MIIYKKESLKLIILKKSLKSITILLHALVAQLDRAFDYGSKGWGFELSQAHQTKIRTLPFTG